MDTKHLHSFTHSFIHQIFLRETHTSFSDRLSELGLSQHNPSPASLDFITAPLRVSSLLASHVFIVGSGLSFAHVGSEPWTDPSAPVLGRPAPRFQGHGRILCCQPHSGFLCLRQLLPTGHPPPSSSGGCLPLENALGILGGV